MPAMADEVVVVGGGLAGIATALAAADGGARVTLLEARPRLGGATFSFQREGLELDNGQHVYLRCCRAYQSLLERLGVRELAPLQPRLDVPVLAPGGRMGRLRRGNLPAPLHLAGTLARYPYLNWSDRLGVVRAALALRRLDPADQRLDQRSFGSWLADQGQSRAATDALWELVGLPTLNARTDQASLQLATMVFKTGLLTAATPPTSATAACRCRGSTASRPPAPWARPASGCACAATPARSSRPIPARTAAASRGWRCAPTTTSWRRTRWSSRCPTRRPDGCPRGSSAPLTNSNASGSRRSSIFTWSTTGW